MRELLALAGRKAAVLLVAAIAANIVGSLAYIGILLTVFFMLETIMTGQGGVSGYWWLMAALLAVKLAANVISVCTSHFSGFALEAKLKEEVILRLKRFSLGFFTKERLGAVSTVVQNDIDSLEGAVAHLGSRTVSDLVVSALVFVCLLALDWRLALVMVCLLPLGFWLQAKGMRHGLELRRRNQENLADLVSRFVEHVKGTLVLRAYPASQDFASRLRQSAERFERSSRAESGAAAVENARYSVPFELGFGLLTLCGAAQCWAGMLEVETLIYFVVFSQEFYRPCASMDQYRMSYNSIRDSLGRINRLLNEPVMPSPSAPVDAPGCDVHFEGVGFTYTEGGFRLKDIEFYAEPGTVTALVGPSGSGKTTVTSLLLRFWDCQQGSIKVGGVNIRELDYDRLLAKVGIVMQDVVLLADTVEANIRLGKAQASREQVEEAARLAMLHDFIVGLPDGYATMLGEGGTGLSGGQRQRLAIARVLLAGAPIVLLDEATSSVDSINEVAIQQALGNLAAGRTVLVIAHRLATVRSADTILVFDAGRIVERGTHEQLLEQNALYRKLWDAQELAKQWSLG